MDSYDWNIHLSRYSGSPFWIIAHLLPEVYWNFRNCFDKLR